MSKKPCPRTIRRRAARAALPALYAAYIAARPTGGQAVTDTYAAYNLTRAVAGYNADQADAYCRRAFDAAA